jgi:Zn-dependent protease
MKWSFSIGRIFGIPIRVHITFLLLLIFVAISPQGGVLSGIMGVVLIILVFVGVLLHELGHSLVARHFGEKVHDIMLLPIGGVSRTEIPEEPRQEMLMAAAGPLVSIALSALFYFLSIAIGYQLDFKSYFKGTGDLRQNLIPSLFYINAMLAVFNLVPAFPLDGGRILRSLLARSMDPIKATRLAVNIGQLVAIVMFFVGIFFDWWLALIAIFLYFGAEAEEQGTLIHRVLHKAKVRSVMLDKFETIPEDFTLDQVVSLACHTSQDDFPVVDNNSLVGLLPRVELFRAVSQLPGETRVREFMVKDFQTAVPDDPLDKVFSELAQGRTGIIPVVENGNLVGILTLAQIAKYQMLCGAKPQARLTELRADNR